MCSAWYLILWLGYVRSLHICKIYHINAKYIDTFSEHYCQNKSISTSININGNISYESILKHRKYGNCDSFVCFFIHRESYEDILTTISPDLRQVTSPIMEVKRYIVSYILYKMIEFRWLTPLSAIFQRYHGDQF
jgi:hypothetical protein